VDYLNSINIEIKIKVKEMKIYQTFWMSESAVLIGVGFGRRKETEKSRCGVYSC
jgi:hypothetical protein